MIKKDRIEDSPEFKYFEEHFDEIMEEMENDPELNNLEIPDEWDREFRKTIEETLKAERRKKMRRISKVVGAAACVVLVVTLGVGFKAEEVEGRGLIEMFRNTFNLNGKQYTTFDAGEEFEMYQDEEEANVSFSADTLEDVYEQIRLELKMPMFYMQYIPDSYNINEANYNKEYNVLNLILENGKDIIYISQQQQFDEVPSGVMNEEEECLKVVNSSLDQEIIIYKSIKDGGFTFNVSKDKTFLVVRSTVSIEECEKMAKNIVYR